MSHWCSRLKGQIKVYLQGLQEKRKKQNNRQKAFHRRSRDNVFQFLCANVSFETKRDKPCLSVSLSEVLHFNNVRKKMKD